MKKLKIRPDTTLKEVTEFLDEITTAYEYPSIRVFHDYSGSFYQKGAGDDDDIPFIRDGEILAIDQEESCKDDDNPVKFEVGQKWEDADGTISEILKVDDDLIYYSWVNADAKGASGLSHHKFALFYEKLIQDNDSGDDKWIELFLDDVFDLMKKGELEGQCIDENGEWVNCQVFALIPFAKDWLEVENSNLSNRFRMKESEYNKIVKGDR